MGQGISRASISRTVKEASRRLPQEKKRVPFPRGRKTPLPTLTVAEMAALEAKPTPGRLLKQQANDLLTQVREENPSYASLASQFSLDEHLTKELARYTANWTIEVDEYGRAFASPYLKPMDLSVPPTDESNAGAGDSNTEPNEQETKRRQMLINQRTPRSVFST
eukprot:TRINITY_DN4492_c0_g1_i1.p1 TRINITY_DN4492_c0_g1~~TRINITY_DN4492_c0_g1_i1.p1  ORF type:complete len:165 (-),score=7.58 TRINITY_DN4492_c0_g1_i1:97-591(-)